MTAEAREARPRIEFKAEFNGEKNAVQFQVISECPHCGAGHIALNTAPCRAVQAACAWWRLHICGASSPEPQNRPRSFA